MANEGKLIYRSGSGADAGKLCYKASGADAGKLAYKAAPVVIGGDITITVISAQAQVGPFSCNNVHDVDVSIAGHIGVGQASHTIFAVSGSLNARTSTGCSYPEENPSMDMMIVAVQPSTGVVKSASHTVENVARGLLTITISVGANRWLTGLEVS